MSQFTDKEIRNARNEELRGLRFCRREIRARRRRGLTPHRADVLLERHHHVRVVALQRWLFERASRQNNKLS